MQVIPLCELSVFLIGEIKGLVGCKGALQNMGIKVTATGVDVCFCQLKCCSTLAYTTKNVQCSKGGRKLLQCAYIRS